MHGRPAPDCAGPPDGGSVQEGWALQRHCHRARLQYSFSAGDRQKQLIIAGVVTEVCVAFPSLSALEEGVEVFVVTDASGTFNELTRRFAWDRMSAAGAQLMTWFGVACELHRDWRNDIEGTLFSNHIADYRNLITSYTTLKPGR